MTDRIVKEALRIYPPAWGLFAREALDDTTIGDWRIPKGAKVFIYPWVVHRDPRFYEDPKRFDPSFQLEIEALLTLRPKGGLP